MVLLLIFVLSISLICCACQNPIVAKRRPCNQPNTTWTSDDERIIFTVDTNNWAKGKMIIDDKPVEFYMTNDMGSGMHIYPITVFENNIIDEATKYEYWLCSYKSKNKFVITVKRTTYFNIGDTIEFNKVADNTSLSN